MLHQKLLTISRTFLIYLILYLSIGALSAWIPFMSAGVMLGGISIAIAATTLAVLRTIDFNRDNRQKTGIKKFIIAITILIIVDVMFTLVI